MYLRVDFFVFMLTIDINANIENMLVDNVIDILRMHSREILPSFLEFDEEEQNSLLRFAKKSVLTLMDLVKEELGHTLNAKFISNHRKQLQTPLFALEAINRHKKWTIIKRLADFVKLEEQLRGKYKDKVPSIPIRKEKELKEVNYGQTLQFFQIFLNALTRNPEIMEEKAFLKFIENFVAPERRKMKIFKQLELLKRAGGRHNDSVFRSFLNMINWSKRSFTITSEGVYFTSGDKDFRIEEMIPFSEGFKLLYGEAETGYTYGILLNSAHRILNVDGENIFNMTYFVYWLRKAMKENNYLSVKRFGSYANIRQKCSSEFYVDGKDYFSGVYEAILSAKSEIFITGWMISPFFCLKRPDPLQESRFDRVIQKVAQLGIKVHIIVYLEPKVALNIDSEFTEEYLTSLSPNIKVLRHPAYVLIPFLWSHHEKMVIVDQKIAFMGGLDIGYGRYDEPSHSLSDQNEQIWPGVDYCNYRTIDILKPKMFEKSSIDRKSQPRMPWHDVGIKIAGESVIDLSRHFVQYWNYVNFQLNMDDRELLLYAGLHEEDIADYQKRDSHLHRDKSKSKIKDKQTWMTKLEDMGEINPRFSRMYSPIHKQHPNLSEQIQIPLEPEEARESAKEDQNSKKPNEPMLRSFSSQFQPDLELDHEEQLQFYATHMKGESSKDTLDKLIKKIKEKKNIFNQHDSRQGMNFEELIVTQGKQGSIIQQGKQAHQLLRSASMWSLGLEEGHEERSILRAYVELIFNSKEFVYIENQFFISVENTVSRAIIERISRAHERKEKFKVVVILPSLPGFEGEIENEDSAVMRVQLNHIYNTICRGGRSILECLNYIEDIDNYIQFFSLRTHGVLNKNPVSEMVYVHSKLMIVDDEKLLIGSANINDRSLLGSRDSEIAILIEDEEETRIKLKAGSIIGRNKQESQVKKERVVKRLSHNLRKELYKEHFAITDEEAEDYHNEDVWDSVIQHADKNQKIYRKVFGIYPDNGIKSFKDIKKAASQADYQQYQMMKELIKGHAVPFQQCFLCKENLDLKPSQKEYYVPNISFT